MSETKLPLIVINLDRSPDRLKRFLADNSLPGLAISRLPAVDGRTLDRDQLVASKVISDDLVYSDNAVACSLSHLHCWQHVIDVGRPAVICEDDAVLRTDFVEIHQRFDAVLADADLVYWNYNFGLHMAYEQPGLGVVTIVPDNEYLDVEANIATFKANQMLPNLYRPRRLWGMACYTITPKGARKLLELVMPLRNGKVDAQVRTGLDIDPIYRGWYSMCLDCDLGVIHVQQMNAWVAVPPIAIHRTDVDNVSTIDDGDDSERFRRPQIDSNGNVRCFVPLESPSVEALTKTANALHDMKRFDMAVAYFDRAIRLNPGLVDLHYRRSNSLFELGRHHEALASFDTVIALAPDHALAFNNRGTALAAVGRLEEALASFDKALSLQPSLTTQRNRDHVAAQMSSSMGTLR